MEQQLKNAFNDIHAPKTLIEDTKKKVSEAQANEAVMSKPKKNYWKAVPGIVAVAACATIIILGKNFLPTTSTQNPQTPIADSSDKVDNDNFYHAAGDTTIKEYIFTETKDLKDWHGLLDQMQTSQTKEITLDSSYIIHTFDYSFNDTTYQINILVQDGNLIFKDNQLTVSGIFKAQILYDNSLQSETIFDISSNSQFTTKDVSFPLEDTNEDGVMDFLLETAENTTNWYTVDEQLNIVLCE